MTSDSELLAQLAAAERANVHARPCQVCSALEKMSAPVRTAVEAALAGTIGGNKLADILTANGYPTGVRAVRSHRKDNHRDG